MGRSPRSLDVVDAYDTHVWDVYGFLAYRTGNAHDAEVLTQAVFERAVRAADRFDPRKASAKTWLLVIAKNLLIDHHRAGRVRETEALQEPDELAEPGDPYTHGPSPEIATALAELSDRDREVVALRFGGDMSSSEIADATGLSVANVQQILSRSLRRMRMLLEELGGARTGAGQSRDYEREQQ